MIHDYTILVYIIILSKIVNGFVFPLLLQLWQIKRYDLCNIYMTYEILWRDPCFISDASALVLSWHIFSQIGLNSRRSDVLQFIPGHVAKCPKVTPWHSWFKKTSWYIRKVLSPEGFLVPKKKLIQNICRLFRILEDCIPWLKKTIFNRDFTDEIWLKLLAPSNLSRSLSRKRVLNKQRNGRRKALKKKRWKLKWKKRKRSWKRKRRCAIEIGSTSDWRLMIFVMLLDAIWIKLIDWLIINY